MVADLQSDLPGVPIHVWRYEDYRAHSEAILRFYTEDAIERFAPPMQGRPKSGFSGRAVAELERHAGSKVGKRRLRAIRERFPVSREYPRFDPWSEAQKRRLGEMYAEDLAELEQRVDLWQPRTGSD